MIYLEHPVLLKGVNQVLLMTFLCRQKILWSFIIWIFAFLNLLYFLWFLTLLWFTFFWLFILLILFIFLFWFFWLLIFFILFILFIHIRFFFLIFNYFFNIIIIWIFYFNQILNCLMFSLTSCWSINLLLSDFKNC